METEAKVFAASVDSLEPIREFLTEKCESMAITKKKTYGLCLAIDEIATNIIRYGYPKAGVPEGEGFLEVISQTGDGKVSITLTDSAMPFDPMAHLIPTEEDMSKPLEDRPIGGLGILLAKQNVDVFKYEFVDNKNKNIFIVNA